MQGWLVKNSETPSAKTVSQKYSVFVLRSSDTLIKVNVFAIGLFLDTFSAPEQIDHLKRMLSYLRFCPDKINLMFYVFDSLLQFSCKKHTILPAKSGGRLCTKSPQCNHKKINANWFK